MKLKKERIAILAQSITDNLIEKEYISPHVSRDELAKRIEHTITEELMVEDRLNEEVRQILKAYSREIEQGNVSYHKMFQMIKNKLVKERGIIL